MNQKRAERLLEPHTSGWVANSIKRFPLASSNRLNQHRLYGVYSERFPVFLLLLEEDESG